MSAEPAESLRVAFVPGVMPEKWFRRFRDRTSLPLDGFSEDAPLAALADGRARMALVRGEPTDESLHRIRLYDEAPGVAVEKEHVLSVTKDTDVAARDDLEGDTVLLDSADAAEVREMLPVAATGAGIVLAPRPLLRALNARGVIHREIEPAGAGPTTIFLAWPKDLDDDVTQEFAGIVRGRREGSRRSTLAGTAGKVGSDGGEERPKLTARQKTLAKQQRREAERAKRAKAHGGRGKMVSGGKGGPGKGGSGRSGKGGGRGGGAGRSGGRGKR